MELNDDVRIADFVGHLIQRPVELRMTDLGGLVQFARGRLGRIVLAGWPLGFGRNPKGNHGDQGEEDRGSPLEIL
jgi:hypothetical protein